MGYTGHISIYIYVHHGSFEDRILSTPGYICIYIYMCFIMYIHAYVLREALSPSMIREKAWVMGSIVEFLDRASEQQLAKARGFVASRAFRRLKGHRGSCVLRPWPTTCTCVYLYIYIYICGCMYVYIYMCIYICAQVWYAYTQPYIDVYAHSYIHVNVCTHVHIHVCIDRYTDTYTFAHMELCIYVNVCKCVYADM